ncbi:hypothetical protein MKZ23_08875 [Paenibacillus sp. FSL R5-0876]|uniref:hypothetical protein n=1 Tax=Paenibacillus sp. FSL R5-0876 TaxID=2921661 RepID=UPI0030F81038
MTQIKDKTDQQLNRALAELMGYTVYHYDKDVLGRCYFELTDPEGYSEIVFGGERNTELEAWADVPNYCTDPAASLEVQTAATKVNAKVYVDTLYDIRLTNEGYTPEIAIGESTYSHDGVVYLFDASPRERAEAAYITLQQKE